MLSLACNFLLYIFAQNLSKLLLLNDMLRVGIEVPTIEVRFEHLNIEAEAHVGSRALPTFTNYMVNMVEVSDDNI